MSSRRITRAFLSVNQLLPSMTKDQINSDMEEDGSTPLHVAYVHNNINAAEDVKEEVKTMVAEERKSRVEMMQSKQEEMMQLTQQEREMEVGMQKRSIKEMGVREYAKAKKEHAKSKIDEKKESAMSKIDEKKDFAKTKLDQLKQKIGAKTAGAQEQE